MISKIDNSQNSFGARILVKRGIPSKINELIKVEKNILPDEYCIKVKNNWKIPILGENYQADDIPFVFDENLRGVKGNMEVVVLKGKRFAKKEQVDSSRFNWWKDKNSSNDSYTQTARQVIEYLRGIKNKLNL